MDEHVLAEQLFGRANEAGMAGQRTNALVEQVRPVDDVGLATLFARNLGPVMGAQITHRVLKHVDFVTAQETGHQDVALCPVLLHLGLGQLHDVSPCLSSFTARGPASRRAWRD